jgi:hypothetical protein
MRSTKSFKNSAILLLLALSAMSAACLGGAKASGNIDKNPTTPAIAIVETPTPAPPKGPGDVKYDASEINEVSIATSYKDFYNESSKCRKDYVEYFGKEDGVASSSSPCRIEIVLNRDTLKAKRTIDIWRWDKTERQFRSVEKTVESGELSADKFKEIAKIVGENEMFENWQDMMITVSNCMITASYPQGKRSVMSNVGPSATTYLPMVTAFEEFDRETKWQAAK